MQLALIFLLFGTVWIILTDGLITDLSQNNISFLSKAQALKGVLFMVVSAIVIFFVSRRIINRQYELQEQLGKERLQYKNELALEVFNAQELERKKIGEELHDNINQMLGVVKLYIEHAQMNPPAREEMLKKSSEYLKQVIGEIRTISKSLVSPTLADIGLVESIRELIESIQKIREIYMNLNSENFNESRLTASQKLMIYRITQEQLNNILKHSQAEHVEIKLDQRDSEVSLIIQDDGVGFDTAVETSGLGLKNMRHRMDMYNGSVKIDSSPQEGCRLEAKFSLA